MSENRKVQGYADFTHEVFHRLDKQIHRHIHVMLESGLTSKKQLTVLRIN